MRNARILLVWNNRASVYTIRGGAARRCGRRCGAHESHNDQLDRGLAHGRCACSPGKTDPGALQGLGVRRPERRALADTTTGRVLRPPTCCAVSLCSFRTVLVRYGTRGFIQQGSLALAFPPPFERLLYVDHLPCMLLNAVAECRMLRLVLHAALPRTTCCMLHAVQARKRIVLHPALRRDTCCIHNAVCRMLHAAQERLVDI